jgi:hypothetical protein
LPKKEIPEEKVYLWTSSQAPGTPASVECLFVMIKESRTETAGFKYGLRHTRISEEKLFEYYELWSQGKVHEDLRNYKERKIDTML